MDEDSLVAEVNGSLMSPGGHLLMRLEPDETETSEESGPAPLSLVERLIPEEHLSAENWFEIGCEHEDAGEWQLAETA